jgi:hypothetical protein
MSLGNTSEQNVLLLLFNNTNWANVGDATGLRGSSVAGSFYVSVHTADPGETGTQTTSEASYTGYARAAVARSGAGWTVSGTAPTQAANAAAVSTGACTAGSETLTHFVVGRDAAAAGEAIFIGALTSSLAVSSGITPSFAIGALVCTAD